MMKEIDISTRECSHIVADIALPEDIYNTFKKDMLVKYYNNEISFDLVEFKNSKYSNTQLPNREKIIVNMQVDDEDFECLLDVCSNNGIAIDELKNATFFEFSILDEYDYMIYPNPINDKVAS
ncbi:MAG: hypothetical protein PHE16_11605 [Aliarcobacter sp.]|nr:hypothetical protein [Aliarcobacter sp.]